jgi:CIC family chloride channel protein
VTDAPADKPPPTRPTRRREALRRVTQMFAAQGRAELRRLGRNSRETLLLAALTGALTGLFVAGFEWVTVDVLFDHIGDLPIGVAVCLPFVGLIVTALIMRGPGRGTSPALADEYLHAFHDPSHELEPRSSSIRLIASAFTLGSGGAMGLEGSSMFAGSTIGSFLQRKFQRYFADSDRRTLLVAGAGAGVAAIFKTPATGAIYALEVPYQDDFARHMLLPTLVASAASYLTFVAFNGTAVLFPISGAPDLSASDLVGALLVGLAAGLCARLFATLVLRAKGIAATWPAPRRVLIAGAVLAGCALASDALTGKALTLGAGYGTIAWAANPHHAAWIALVLLVLGATATAATIMGGGVGGLFVPLVVAGVLLGRAVGGAIEPFNSTLFLVIGAAAFLGAGYRVPLAGVMFVAESTGRPGFIVPALIAAVAAELVMGRASVTPYQMAADDIVPPPMPDDSNNRPQSSSDDRLKPKPLDDDT